MRQLTIKQAGPDIKNLRDEGLGGYDSLVFFIKPLPQTVMENMAGYSRFLFFRTQETTEIQ